MPCRWIAHLDMDAFYASVELLRYPELRGRAVVVGGRQASQPGLRVDGARRFSALDSYAGRGVVTTATYEARALGVHSGMGLMKAAALAPDAVLLAADFDEYRKYSRLFKAAVAEVAPVIEDRGIDEIYIDLTQVPGAQVAAGADAEQSGSHAGLRAIAERIKARVYLATGLSCSVGVAPNKLLSKMADPRGYGLAHLAACRQAHQRHRPEVRRETRSPRDLHHRRARGRASAAAGRTIRVELWRLAARSGAWPGRAPAGDVQRAKINKP